MDWKKIVAHIAPTIGMALGGPLGGMAATAVTEALGLSDSATDDDITLALQSPDALVKLKQADQDFQVKMKSLDIDLEKINAGDRDSARKMHTDNPTDNTPKVLGGYIATLATIVVAGTGILLYSGKLSTMGAVESSILTLVIREIMGKLEQVCNFEFGSSSSSRSKDATIKNMTK